MVVIAAEIPDNLPIPAYTENDLPFDWNAAVPPSPTKDLGSVWAKVGSSLAISVPSAVVPDERNYLVNPLHSDFSKIKFSAPKPFVFDPRLKK
jgi:RES domain-containing protein